MAVPKVFESEYRFCLILWEHEPITSRELSVLCKDKRLYSPMHGESPRMENQRAKRLTDRSTSTSEEAAQELKN